MSYEDKILEMKNPGFQSVFFWFPYEKRSQNIPIWGKPVVFKFFSHRIACAGVRICMLNRAAQLPLG